MLIIEKIAETKIKEAMKSGSFDNLPGKGKPVDLSNYFILNEKNRIAFSILENANILPAEVQQRKEIEVLKNKLQEKKTEEERRKLRLLIIEKETQFQISLERQRRK